MWDSLRTAFSGPREDEHPIGPSADWGVDGAIVLCALLVRLFRADAQSLWYDEGTSAALVQRTVGQILDAAAHDIHPPLYYLLLSGWSRMFGDGVLALRSLSAVVGTLGVAGILVLSRRLFRHRPLVRWTAGLLAALPPFLVWYGQEVRMYVLAATLGTWLCWVAHRVTWPRRRTPRVSAADDQRRGSPGRGWWIGAGVLSCAALYTQYISGSAAVLAANLIAALGLAARWTRDGRPPVGRASSWALTQVAAVIAFLPWLALAWPTLRDWPAVGGDPLTSTWLTEVPIIFALGTAVPDALSAHWPWVAGVAAMGLLLGWLDVPTIRTDRSAGRPTGMRLATTALAAYVVATPLTIFVASLRRTAWKPKFLLTSAPAFEMLAALGIVLGGRMVERWIVERSGWPRIGRLAGRMVGAALFAAIIVPRWQVLQADWYDPAVQRDDYRGLISDIARHAGPSDAVLLTAPTQVEIYDYYAERIVPELRTVTAGEVDLTELPRYPLPRERPPRPDELRAALNTIVDQHRDIYGVIWAEDEADPDGIVLDHLDDHRARAFDRWYGDVRMVLWAAQRDTECDVRDRTLAHLGPIELEGIAVDDRTATPGGVLTLAATWRASEVPATDYVVFLHLVDPEGAIVAQRDMQPDDGRGRTSRWSPVRTGESSTSVRDELALAVPPDSAPGEYQLRLGLYDPVTGNRAPVSAPDRVASGVRPSAACGLRVDAEADALRIEQVMIIDR